jgi:SAM-dependent methyltransferase
VTPSTGSFEFFGDYEKTVYALQPELYAEIRRVVNGELKAFAQRRGRAAEVLDVGSAGLIPYDAGECRSITILDLFAKPEAVLLKENVSWRVGDILAPDPEAEGAYDFVIMSSLLHHLADQHNNAVKNVQTAFRQVARRLRPEGVALVFESFCPGLLAAAQDLLYPLYSRLLVRAFRFTYVRMISFAEGLRAIDAAGLSAREEAFRQPTHIAQMRWRVPSRYYPLKVRCLRAAKALVPEGK